MASYGRNFHTRISPYSQQRHGRFQLMNGSNVPLGAPIEVAPTPVPSPSLTGALPVRLATGGGAPRKGQSGILIYEWIDMNGLDVAMSSFADRDTAPDTDLVQLITGPNVKVVFKNTVARTFMGARNYPGRTMVANLNGLNVGDFLAPGTGTDADGYWAATGTAANAWLVVTSIDTLRLEVEAETVNL